LHPKTAAIESRTSGSRFSVVTDKVLFVYVCGAVALSPILYGSTDTIIVLDFEFISFLALAVLAVRQVVTGDRLRFHVLFIPFAIFALYVLIQTLPIFPGTNISGIDASLLGQTSAWHSISLDPNSTRASLIKLLSVGFCGFLAFNLIQSRERLNVLVLVIIIVGAALALIAIIQDLTWDNKIYWLRESPYKALGPFVNKDHGAGYFELPFGLALGMLLGGAVRNDRKIIFALFVLVTGTAIVISRSRGGVVSLAGAVVIAVVLSSLKETRKQIPGYASGSSRLRVLKAAVGVVVLVVGIFGAALWINKDALGYSLTTLSDQQTYQNLGSRGEIWRATLEMSKQNPVAGLGFGAYGVSFPRFSRLKGNLVTDYAHNDYLQILADTGIIGSLIVLTGLIIFATRNYRTFRKARGYIGGVHFGAIVGISAILIHSLFDFNLQIYSTGLTFMVLVCVCCAIEKMIGQTGLDMAAVD